MSAPDPIKKAWQASVTAPALPPIETIRSGADLFYRKVRRRNRIEFAACALSVLCFSFYVFWLPLVTARIGSAMIVIGTLFAAWQLHRRAPAVAPPNEAGATSILAHTRAQLVRQRDALASIFTWYMLPFLPGLLVMMFAPVIERTPMPPGQDPRGAWWLAMGVIILLFAFLWWLNRRGARKLQKHIDDIDALTERPAGKP